MPAEPIASSAVLTRDGVFEVARSLFTDPALHALEMRAIFEGTWLYLCHESQIARPGDWFTTHMGRQPVVIVRGQDQKVRGFINACAHRGAMLCRTRKGNSKFLTCPYHGWVYGNDGRNVQIKDHSSGAYPSAFEAQSHDLTAIPKLTSYRGFVFGSLNPEVASLAEHLGDASVFIDLLVDQSADGLEVLPGASSYVNRGNWKLQPENGLDGYHFTTVHANYLAMMARRAPQGGEVRRSYDDSLAARASGWYEFAHGHGVMWATYPRPEARPVWEWRADIEQRMSPQRARWILHHQRNVLIYPNLLLQDNASTQIRVIRPLDVASCEVSIYAVAPVGESPAARTLRLRQYEDFFNATGVATPDDLLVFEACQQGFAGSLAAWQQGYARGGTRIHAGQDQHARALGIHPLAWGDDFQDESMLHGQFRQWAHLLEKVAKPSARHAAPLPGKHLVS
ncbi:Rieske 2Fe-2S domain-containing protein [Immundisolibacter sp.]|uniref:aromatic ring-hydroxylating oxygenase subunit alpha n=1 Tax=Immundisolibacter sp. TaxID=1934948 RepID=UPI003567B5E1